VIRVAETAADLDVYARVWSEIHPGKPISGYEVRRRFAEWDDGRRYLVAEANGVAVGTGFASHTSTPGRAAAVVAVLSAHRRRGMGSALLDASLAHARSLGASSVSGSLAEPELPWAERRGFEEFDLEVEFVLDLTGVIKRPVVPDVEIGELEDDELEDAHRLYTEGVADIPSPEPLDSSFERWQKRAEAAPLVLVAREAGRIVGYAELERRTDEILGHELTAVARTHRRRGIARALKQTQIAWATERGYRRLITSTHSANEATRRLNESLGYRALPPLVEVRRELELP
jgi:GNAT superfamily N-acetyltransferase